MGSPTHQAVDELRLPDLDTIVRNFQSIATELPNLRNIPAFNQGAEILNEMRRMNEKMERIDQKIDSFDGRFKAMDVNNVARLVNSTLIDADGLLSPLRNVTTSEPIDQFPATPWAIRGMQSAAVDTVLRALGIEIDGPLEQKKQRLRVQIGLIADPA